MKVYGALRVAVKMLLMLNSQIYIDGGGKNVVTTSLLEVRNLVVLTVRIDIAVINLCLLCLLIFISIDAHSITFLLLQQNSVISSNTNLGIYGQGLLRLTGQGDAIIGQRLSLSLFYNITVSASLAESHHGFIRFSSILK